MLGHISIITLGDVHIHPNNSLMTAYFDIRVHVRAGVRVRVRVTVRVNSLLGSVWRVHRGLGAQLGLGLGLHIYYYIRLCIW